MNTPVYPTASRSPGAPPTAASALTEGAPILPAKQSMGACVLARAPRAVS